MLIEFEAKTKDGSLSKSIDEGVAKLRAEMEKDR